MQTKQTEQTKGAKGIRFLLVLLLASQILYALLKTTLPVSLPYISKDPTLTISKAQIGSIYTLFALTYGASKLVGGILSDGYVSCELLYGLGLFMGSIVNLMIFFIPLSMFSVHENENETDSSFLYLIGGLWVINGMGQGIGGPALTKLITTMFDPSSVGFVWSTLTFASNLGYLCKGLILVPLIVYTNGNWQITFLFVGACALAVSIMLYLTCKTIPACSLKDSTSEVQGEMMKNKHPNPKSDPVPIPVPVPVPVPNLIIGSVALHSTKWQQKNAYVITVLEVSTILISSAITYFTLKGMHDWTGFYLVEVVQISNMAAVELMLWNEIGGITGSFSAGLLSDWLGAFLVNRRIRKVTAHTDTNVRSGRGVRETKTETAEVEVEVEIGPDEDRCLRRTGQLIVSVCFIGMYLMALFALGVVVMSYQQHMAIEDNTSIESENSKASTRACIAGSVDGYQERHADGETSAYFASILIFLLQIQHQLVRLGKSVATFVLSFVMTVSEGREGREGGKEGRKEII